MGTDNFKTKPFDGAAGDIAVVDAVSGKKIALHGYVIAADTANGSMRFEDGAGGTALTGSMEMLIDAAVVAPFSNVPWAIGSVNTTLSLEATSTGLAGHIIYSEID